MKKVHFVLGEGTYPDLVGGMEIFNYYLIKELQKDYAISYSAIKRLNFSGQSFHHYFKIRPTKISFPLQLFFYLLFHPGRTLFFSFSAAHWLIWYLYTLVARILRLDYIVVIHYGKEPPVTHQKVYQNFFQQAKHIVAVSENIKKEYDEQFHINCTTIFPLVPFKKNETPKNELRQRYDIPIDAFVICMVGTIKEMKNPQTVVEALAKLPTNIINRYNPHIVYAGTGPSINHLKEIIARHDLQERCHLLGFVPKEKTDEVYALSDAYVIASDFEGTSVSLLEAMFNGMPIIASRAPGIIDTISENRECLLFTPKKSDELKAQLLTVMTNPSLAEKKGKAARVHYECDYNFNEVVKSYIEIINDNPIVNHPDP